jgi:hypothetical protein
VTAPFGAAGDGRVYVTTVTGSGAVSLATAPVILDGIGDGTGQALTVRGGVDWSGDGAADFLISAWGADLGGIYDAGEVFLFHGPVSAGGSWSDANVVVRGTDKGTGIGTAADFVGDVDGDGDEDVALGGARHEWYGMYGYNWGRVWLVSPDDHPGGVYADDDIAPTVASTDKDRGYSGSIPRAGDVDGDGVDDLVVGGTGLHVYLGPVGTSMDLTDADVVLEASSTTDPGAVTAGPGDMDGDGVADLLLADPEYNSGTTRTGLVWLITSVAPGRSSVDEVATATIEGNSGDERSFGTTLRGAGDLDGDGSRDVVAGAVWDAATKIGSTRVFYGPLSGVLASADADLVIGGEDPSEPHRSVAILPDGTGDGVTDIAIGVDGDADSGAYAGAVFVFSGAP